MTISQIWNGMRDAQFGVSADGVPAGSILFEMARLPLLWHARIQYRNQDASMSPCRLADAGKLMQKGGWPLPAYSFSTPVGNGTAVRTDAKILIRKAEGRYALSIGSERYLGYAAAFGRDGLRLPIYRDGTCVIELRKPSLVQNELHEFEVLLTDKAMERDEWAALLISCYLWAACCRSKGGMSSGWRQTETVTTDRFLLTMCRDGVLEQGETIC